MLRWRDRRLGTHAIGRRDWIDEAGVASDVDFDDLEAMALPFRSSRTIYCPDSVGAYHAEATVYRIQTLGQP